MPRKKRRKISVGQLFNEVDDNKFDMEDDSCELEESLVSVCSSEAGSISGSNISKDVCPSVVKICKPQDESLPDPFPLPKNFPSEVEIALRTEKMTKETNRVFLSAVAAAMLGYKRYPTKEEYTRVAKDIIQKYPFMRPSNGSPTVSMLDLFCLCSNNHVMGSFN